MKRTVLTALADNPYAHLYKKVSEMILEDFHEGHQDVELSLTTFH